MTEVNKLTEQIIWLVAPVSKTQVLQLKAFLFITLVAKIECFKLKEVPASGVVAVTLLAIAVGITSGAAILPWLVLEPPIIAKILWHCFVVKGKAWEGKDCGTEAESSSITPKFAPKSGLAT